MPPEKNAAVKAQNKAGVFFTEYARFAVGGKGIS
jgi:hypothetical protein